MTTEPPPFQEAARCDICKSSFNTFRRRHHCRCCGRTLCYEHSSNQMALPQFGILSNVRVCADCFNNSSRSVIVDPQLSVDEVNSVTSEVSRLDIGAEAGPKAELNVQPQSGTVVVDCKCGMPLCICESPVPAKEELPLQTKSTATFTSQVHSRPKKTDAIPKNKGSTSNSKPSSVFNHGQVTNGAMDKPQMDYEVSGEGLREAIKNDDALAVKKLLDQGLDANYCDKQGMSLLHLAALFNRTDIAFILMESGASLDFKNAQGETPLDCAPVTLQYKMRQRMNEMKTDASI